MFCYYRYACVFSKTHQRHTFLRVLRARLQAQTLCLNLGECTESFLVSPDSEIQLSLLIHQVDHHMNIVFSINHQPTDRPT